MRARTAHNMHALGRIMVLHLLGGNALVPLEFRITRLPVFFRLLFFFVSSHSFGNLARVLCRCFERAVKAFCVFAGERCRLEIWVLDAVHLVKKASSSASQKLIEKKLTLAACASPRYLVHVLCCCFVIFLFQVFFVARRRVVPRVP